MKTVARAAFKFFEVGWLVRVGFSSAGLLIGNAQVSGAQGDFLITAVFVALKACSPGIFQPFQRQVISAQQLSNRFANLAFQRLRMAVGAGDTPHGMISAQLSGGAQILEIGFHHMAVGTSVGLHTPNTEIPVFSPEHNSNDQAREDHEAQDATQDFEAAPEDFQKMGFARHQINHLSAVM